MSEWDQRQLCPDGGCVGVIGAEGTCKVCGRAAPNWGDERRRGLVATAVDSDAKGDDEDDEEYEDEDEVAGDEDEEYEDDEGDDEDGDDEYEDDEDYEDDAEGDEDGVIAASSEAGGGEWTKRTLCPDGGCVGVIGSNGTCKVCGRSAE